ncbi:MAG: hypothetical protein AAGI23_13745 [Bacteroidota bacterium]
MNTNQDILRQALTHDQEGNWQAAHHLVDGLPGKSAAHIHAYLHRKEGDEWNARYWYDRANKSMLGNLIF